MEELKNKEVEQKAPTMTIEVAEYEKLRTENVKLRSDMKMAIDQMREMNSVIVEKRITFLFKVIENSVHFDDGFVGFCASEIKTALCPTEEKENEDGE